MNVGLFLERFFCVIGIMSSIIIVMCSIYYVVLGIIEKKEYERLNPRSNRPEDEAKYVK